jgi:hypothetical protein
MAAKLKRKPKSIQYTPTATIDQYIEHMLQIGLWGTTRAQVLARLFEEGLARRFFGKEEL